MRIPAPYRRRPTRNCSRPGLEEFIGRWQSRYPYRVVWANHEPLDQG